jgi:hypothetical protein
MIDYEECKNICFYKYNVLKIYYFFFIFIPTMTSQYVVDSDRSHVNIYLFDDVFVWCNPYSDLKINPVLLGFHTIITAHPITCHIFCF